MRNIDARKIKETVAELCVSANIELRKDILKALKSALRKEKKGSAREALSAIIKNAEIARKENIPLCQDTGFVSVYLELGGGVRLKGGLLKDAVTEGVKKGYREGFLRKSVVADPLRRRNTGNNTPCLIYLDIVKGNKLKITVSPKGFGSENKSVLRMLKPTEGPDDILGMVLEAAKDAGPDACPPFILGIGIGSTFEGAAYLSKKALLRPVDRRNKKGHLAALERKILRAVNRLNIGPMGLGGTTTALAVNIEAGATHIAGLPVAVCMGCHVTRSKSKVI